MFRLSENHQNCHREIPKNNLSRALPKHFPNFYHSPNFYEKFSITMVNERLQFCSVAKFIEQDSNVLPNDQPNESDCEKIGKDE